MLRSTLALSSPEVLVVDDDPLVLATLADCLRQGGLGVIEAIGAREALALLAERPTIQLLLSDIAMPGMNGCALAEAATQLRPGLPVVLISGYPFDHVSSEWLRLRKPARMADLLATVNMALSREPQAARD